MMAGNYSTLAPASISSARAGERGADPAENNPAWVPYDGAAQQALLGSILLAGGILPDVMAILSGGADAFWGETDKRLLAFEPKFSRLLKVAARDGNTVSAMIRLAWDNGDLHVLTRTPTKATGAHISIIGHITREELAAELTKTDAANGFGNRFLWVCARPSMLLARGGNLQETDIEPLRQRLISALQFAAGIDYIGLSDEAWNLWEQKYRYS
ncbi:MAG: hypothetical protein ACP5QA_12540, partial [Phycisphaerae bacterium]